MVARFMIVLLIFGNVFTDYDHCVVPHVGHVMTRFVSHLFCDIIERNKNH
jgi:hypothetical protein